MNLQLDATACEEMTMQTLSNDKLKAAKLLEAMGDTEQTVNMGTASTNFTTTNFSKVTKSNLECTSFDPDSSSMNSSLTTCMTTTTNLNNTLFSAVRDPFNTDVKNRLLVRDSSSIIKKPNYKNLIVQHPIVKEKQMVLLMDGVNYTILEMIGKGAFAKIYLIQNKMDREKPNKKMALKVRQHACD